MVLRFSIENFRSIKDKVEFSMEPAPIKEHLSNVYSIGKNKALRTSVIYGPNASGKSNIIRAFRAISYLVSNSSDFKPDKSIDPYEPYRLDKSTSSKPVNLEIEFVALNGKRYLFYLSYSRKVIEKEEVYIYQKNQKALLYSRTKDKVRYGDYYKGDRKSVENRMLSNQLFISKAVLDKNSSLSPIYEFLNNILLPITWIHDHHQNRFQQLYAKRLAKNDDIEFIKRFNKLICALDTGVHEVTSQEEDWDTFAFPESVPDEVKESLKKEYKYKINTIHKVFDENKEVGIEYFDRDDESQGTKNLFSIAGIILDVLEIGSTLIVDEFDNNLHPHITKVLIQLFNNPNININNAQLIFATHDISQLDNDVFRRDQIWFTEKNEFGSTSLFSLIDINGVRNTVPYDKWYASGKFGATPLIDELELLFHAEG